MRSINPLLRAAGLSLLTAAVCLKAQNAAPATLEEKDKTIVLSPFVVDSSQDQGYLATNSTSGSRLNTPVKDLPMSLEVITSQFMKDIGATDLRQALAYSAGIVLDSQQDFAPDINSVTDDVAGATGSKEGTTVKIRGFMTTETLRNGFRRNVASDSINIDRVEVVRGPSGLLYGVGNVGGIINYMTKRPLPQRSFEITTSVGSWDYYRTTIDLTGPIGDKAGYRLTGATSSQKDWTEFKGSKSNFISPVFEFKPFTNTNVVIDVEAGNNHYDGRAFQGVRSTIKGLSDQSSRRLSGFLPIPGKDEKTFRWGGPDSFSENRYTNLNAEITQKVGENLTFLVGAQTSETSYFMRRISAQINVYGATTPAYVDPSLIRILSFYPVGLGPRLNRRSVIAYAWSTDDVDVRVNQVRLEGNYHLKTKNTEHNFLLGHTELSRHTDTVDFGIPPNQLQNFNYKAPDDTSYFRFDPAHQPTLQRTAFNNVKATDAGSYAVWQGKFFNDKLQSVAGIRYDRSDAFSTIFNTLTGAVASTHGSVTGKAITKTSPQIGLNYAITKAISVYGLYSTGLIPNYDKQDGNGAPFKPSTATSKEFGVKVDLLDGKISGTIAAYRIKRKDTPYYVFWAPNNVLTNFDPTKPVSYEEDSAFNRVLFVNNPVDKADLETAIAGLNNPNDKQPFYDITYGYGGGNNPSLDQGAYCPVDDDSKGYDAQVILTPVKDWQLVLTYAHVKRELTQGPAFVKYLKGNSPYALWMISQVSGVDIYGGGGLSNYSDPTDTSTYNRSFAKGLAADDTPTDTFTFWSNYSFRHSTLVPDFLKGFSVGVGGQYESARDYLGSALTSNGIIVRPTSGNVDRFDPAEPKYIVNGLVSYTTKIAKADWRFSVNVYNLLDNQKRYGDLYTTPRSVRFTAGVTF